MNRTLFGDCRLTLPTLDAASVQTCVTSPPYWGLRDYGTATWSGGDAEHEHDRIAARNGRGGSGSPGKQTTGAFPSDLPASVCSCGAVRIDSQIGLETTPDEYVANLVGVFREVRRTLRDDGTLWLNLGDSYASGCTGGASPSSTLTGGGGRYRDGSKLEAMHAASTTRSLPPGLKPKDLVGIPWRVAFALQADGWYLRSDIIWAKPNPMPESVTDRPTKSHEYLFLLTKNERYYYDAKAIAEPAVYPGDGIRVATPKNLKGLGLKPTRAYGEPTGTSTRNKRSVWTIATQPYAEAHFATFPPKLIEPCILAGSRPGDTVLDPFMGSGTTAHVAQEHGRQWIGCELNPNYADLQAKRTRQATLAFP